MKKLMCFSFAVLLTLILVGCSSAPTDSSESATTTGSSTVSPTIQTTTPPASAVEFQEITLVDNEDVTVKITGIQEDNIWGYTLKTYLENKTDKELMFTVDAVSVNGFMCDPLWAATVSAGKKANENISFTESSFEENGIETVTEVSFTLRVYDNNDWTADDLLKEAYTINP